MADLGRRCDGCVFFAIDRDGSPTEKLCHHTRARSAGWSGSPGWWCELWWPKDVPLPRPWEDAAAPPAREREHVTQEPGHQGAAAPEGQKPNGKHLLEY